MALGVVDIICLVISILITAGIGIYQGIIGLNATPKEYMLGGQNLNPIPLALSMTVGTVSAITIMANAGEMYAYGTQLWMMDLGIAIGLVIVARVFIPIFYPMQMVSVYQYVEKRFQSKILRQATVLITMIQGYIFIGFLLYPPVLMLQYLTNLNSYVALVVVGLSSTIYSSFGGVKAVVYTDAFQSIVMIIGVLAIVIQAGMSVGGISQAWDIAYHNQRIELFNFSLDPFQRHSFWLTVIFGIFFSLSTYGVNQCQIQRAFSTGSVREAQLVFYYAAVGMVILRGIINLSGVMVYSYFHEIGCDPITTSLPGKDPSLRTESIIIIYVSTKLTEVPGLTGLFVASIYAAVLSSVSTQVNSLTALLWEDFLKPLPVFAQWTDIKITKLQKILVCLSGIVGIFSALVVSNILTFLQALFTITGAMNGPMIGLFLVAIYIPWVKWKAVALSYGISVIISLWIGFGQMSNGKQLTFLPMMYDNCTEGLIFHSNVTSSEPNYGEGLYGLSYCLNFCWGSITCVLCAMFFSLFMETNNPETVSDKYIDPVAWKYFKNWHDLRSSSNSWLTSTCNCLPFIKIKLEESIPVNESQIQDNNDIKMNEKY